MKGTLKNNKFMHPCNFGCCSGAAQTRQRLVSVLLTLFVFRRPPVPALNKWTTLFPALSYWCVATNLFNVIGRMWEMVFTEKRLMKAVADSGTTQIALTAPVSSEALSTINVVRAGKVLRWVRHPKAPVELLIVCIAMRPVLSLMGFLFQEESTHEAHGVTILLKEDNAARQVVTFLVAKILDLDDFWAVFFYEGWDTFRLQMALDTFLLIAAAIWRRVMQLLKTYPWALWMAVDPEQPMEKRRRRCQETRECCQSCFDREFTLPFLQEYDVDDLLVEGSPANRLVTKSIRKCRATNIMSELKFSPILKHLMSSVFARAANASTMASKHVLAEFASMHSRAATAWEEADAVPAADIKLFSAKAKSGWHLYLAEQRSLGIKIGSK